MPFSERLKTLRKNKGLSHEELAEKLDIDRTSIVHYENSANGRIPRPKRLKKIADFFGVSIDYLLDRTTDGRVTDDEREFLSDTNQLSIEELQKKYELTIDDTPASEDEIEAALDYIRSIRDKNA